MPTLYGVRSGELRGNREGGGGVSQPSLGGQLMPGFDQAWLNVHQTRMATFRGEPVKPSPLLIEFSIPVALKLPNQANGRHWTASYAYRKRLLPMVAGAVKPWAGHLPMERARVEITRFSVGVGDQDNVTASVKPLLDLLLVRSATHPHSFGLLVDDGPDHITLTVIGAKVAHRSEQKTAVRIERLG